MARNDQTGFFWDDYIPPKIKKEVKKCIPPQPVWTYDDYLPRLDQALEFNVDLFSVEDLRKAWINKEKLIFDIECYENYVLIAFKSVITGKVAYWEMQQGDRLATDSLLWLIENFTIISFNGWNYDIPILTLALAGRDCKTLKQATTDLIVYNQRPYELLKNYKCRKIKFLDHIDLIEVAPLSGSLKIYAGRLHCKKMQDLPFNPDKVLNQNQIAILRWYCINGDIVNTLDLYNSLKTELELRNEMSSRYKIDLRSKSDAQIAEAVIKINLENRGIKKVNIPSPKVGSYFYYQPPKYLKFQTLNILERLANNPFFIKDNGKPAACYYADFIDWSDKGLRMDPLGTWVTRPKDWKYNPIIINGTEYTMGIGGLHSVEKSVSYYSDDNHTLKDVDVESYYPRIILNLGLYPEQLGRLFLTIFDGIVKERLTAKKRASEIKTEIKKLKAMLNQLD